MSENIIDKIKNDLDIVTIISEYLPLTKKGKNFWGICPFHSDSNPSMSVSQEKQFYKCFSCGAGGDIIHFVSEKDKISRDQAIKKLAAKLGIELKSVEENERYTEHQLKYIHAYKETMQIYQYNFEQNLDSDEAKYALNRGLNSDIRELFKIGLAKDLNVKDLLLKKGIDEATMINASLINAKGKDFFYNRLIFGITDEFGSVVAFSARSFDKNISAKYINSSESPIFSKSKILYNFFNAKDEIERTKSVYICEGQMDVIAMHKAGYKNAVAIMGVALTRDHLTLIAGKQVILNLDTDRAGQVATLTSIKTLLDAKFKVSVIKNSKGKDMDEILSKEGIAGVTDALSIKISASDFAYAFFLESTDFTNPESIESFIKSFGYYYQRCNDIERELYITKMENDLKISEETIRSFLPSFQYSKQVFEEDREHNIIKVGRVDTTEIIVSHSELARHYTYRLIKSLLEKPFLREYYLKQKFELQFINDVYTSILNFIENFEHDKSLIPSDEVKKNVHEIQKSEVEIIEDENMFRDVVREINYEFYSYYIQQFKLKLKDINNKIDLKSREEAEMLLNLIREYHKKMENL